MKKLLVIMALTLLVGCGAKKKQHAEAQLDVKTELEQKDTTATVIETNFHQVHEAEDSYVRVVPVDVSTAMVVVAPDGAVWQFINGQIEKGASKEKTETNAQEKKTEHKGSATTAAQEVKAAAASGGSERKATVNWTLVFIIVAGVALLLLFIYIVWRKRKK